MPCAEQERQAAEQYLRRFLAGGSETLRRYGLDLTSLWPLINWNEIYNSVLLATTVREYRLGELRQAASYFVYWGRLKTVCDLSDDPDVDRRELALALMDHNGLSQAEVDRFSRLQQSLTTPLAS